MGERLSNLRVKDLCLLEHQLEKSLHRIKENKVAQLLSVDLFLLLTIIPSHHNYDAN
jgi:hypothetical protein